MTKCDKFKRTGHTTDNCRVSKCTYCKKLGHKDNQCWVNPKSPVFRPREDTGNPAARTMNTLVSENATGKVATVVGDKNDSDDEDHNFNDTLIVGQVSQVTGCVEKLGVAFGPTPTLSCSLFRSLTHEVEKVSLLPDSGATVNIIHDLWQGGEG